MLRDTSTTPRAAARAWRKTGWVLLGAAALAACSSAETGSNETPPPDAFEPVSREQLFASMAGIASGDQARVVDVSLLHEEETLKGECMREAGFDYITANPNMLTDYAPQTNIHDPDFAKNFGFGISAETYGGIEPNPNDQTIMALSESESQSWAQSEERCTVDARAAVEERLGEMEPLLKLADDINQIAKSNDGFLQAQAAWKQCMTDAGFQFSGNSFDDLFQEHLDRYAADPENYDRSAEIDAAVASASCDGDQWEKYRAAIDAALQQVDPTMFSSTRDFDA